MALAISSSGHDPDEPPTTAVAVKRRAPRGGILLLSLGAYPERVPHFYRLRTLRSECRSTGNDEAVTGLSQCPHDGSREAQRQVGGARTIHSDGHRDARRVRGAAIGER